MDGWTHQMSHTKADLLTSYTYIWGCLALCCGASWALWSWKVSLVSTDQMHHPHSIWTTKSVPDFGECPLLDKPLLQLLHFEIQKNTVFSAYLGIYLENGVRTGTELTQLGDRCHLGYRVGFVSEKRRAWWLDLWWPFNSVAKPLTFGKWGTWVGGRGLLYTIHPTPRILHCPLPQLLRDQHLWEAFSPPEDQI